jgi:predicted secreted protein
MTIVDFHCHYAGPEWPALPVGVQAQDSDVAWFEDRQMDCRSAMWKRAFFSDQGRNAPGTASTVTRREHCGRKVLHRTASAPVVRTGVFRSSSNRVLAHNSAESIDSPDLA